MHLINLTDFTAKIPQRFLDIEDKSRSNLFAWRGQFSPQLIEVLLAAYCPPKAVILDPFAGSGTVLHEAAKIGQAAYGFEINPSAWIFSKLYEFSNISPPSRELIIRELQDKIVYEFPIILFSEKILPPQEIEIKFTKISESISNHAKILCNALVVSLDMFNRNITGGFIQSKFMALADLLRGLPCSGKLINADLQDARHIPLKDKSIDFVVTSPPYINVFNYHQNYRRSVESLGWNVLRVARSEIGSNRANRGNRFFTVVQYCIDIASVLQELARVIQSNGRLVFVVGYESRVLGVPFYNAKIVEQLAERIGIFDMVLKQKRVFKNRFGQNIREDLLNMTKKTCSNNQHVNPVIAGRAVATTMLEDGFSVVAPKDKKLLNEALSNVETIDGTQLFDSSSYASYQTRNSVMMVKENIR